MKPVVPKRAGRRRGASLVEVMVALIILALLALGGASFMMQSGTSIALQGRKRIATELANARMEDIRAMPVAAITNLVPKAGWHYLTKDGAGTWQVDVATLETNRLNGFAYPLQMRVQYVPGSDYLMELESKCGYVTGTKISGDFAVSLHTYYLPDIQYYR